MIKLNPPQIIVCSFLAVILIGSFLLYLPISTNISGSMKYVDALFTATSAVCVTGLIVKDTGSFFTGFGQWIILILFQLGGLGIMTLSILLALFLGRKVSINEKTVLQSTITGSSGYFKNLPKVLKNIVKVVISIELIGAGLLFIRFNFLNSENIFRNLYSSIFHSISAFCNAGFSLYKDSFIRYSSDIYINLIMGFLIIIGGLGFIVVLTLPQLKLWKKNRKIIWARLNVQTKIVLIVSFVLIILGFLVLFILEYNNTMEGFSLNQRVLTSFFQSVTSRTAGFNTLDISMITLPSQFFIIILMFIGASPGSTGSGIKTTTFAILLAIAIAMFKNKSQVSIFGRTVPKEVVREALLIFLFSLSWLFIVMFGLLITESLHFQPASFIQIMFEATSAFGNVGLSTGITGSLNSISKILIVLTMLVGRIGPLTLAWAVVLHTKKVFYKYPEEKIMVG